MPHFTCSWKEAPTHSPVLDEGQALSNRRAEFVLARTRAANTGLSRTAKSGTTGVSYVIGAWYASARGSDLDLLTPSTTRSAAATAAWRLLALCVAVSTSTTRPSLDVLTADLVFRAPLCLSARDGAVNIVTSIQHLELRIGPASAGPTSPNGPTSATNRTAEVRSIDLPQSMQYQNPRLRNGPAALTIAVYDLRASKAADAHRRLD